MDLLKKWERNTFSCFSCISIGFTIESLKLTKFPRNLSDIQLNVSSDHVYRELHRFWQKFLCSVIVLEHVS